MRRATGHGFALSLILNMLFRAEWLIGVAVLILLHFLLGWSLWLVLIPVGCWFLHALLITLILGWANSKWGVDPPVHENKNPYSAKNEDVFGKK